MRFNKHSLAVILCLSSQIGVAQNAPLSAIDWLDEKNAPADASEPTELNSIVEPEIQVVPLEDISRNSVAANAFSWNENSLSKRYELLIRFFVGVQGSVYQGSNLAVCVHLSLFYPLFMLRARWWICKTY